jgi:hypothetical protein
MNLKFLLALCFSAVSLRAELKLATFDLDVTPPLGSMMAYDRVTNTWDMSLRARGITILGAGEPIVLCSIDWIGIANEAHDEFRAALAKAAGTTPSRVTVHCIHQHDAPDADFGAEKILRAAGVEPGQFESTWQRVALANLAAAVKTSLATAQPITHLGLGKANVIDVASNRRIPGPDGKIKGVRYTATKDPALRDAPVGVVDSEVSLVSFWNNDKPIAVLSYFATHPQSYYRTGIPNPDFPGLARFMRQLAVPAALHVHFNGAGGNIGAGKWNDGSPENRRLLAERLADGMRRAWDATKKQPLAENQIAWAVEPVALPPSAHLDPAKLDAQLRAREATFITLGGASRLAFLQRMQAGKKIDITCLTLGSARILHMPGELFVEYQLAAKKQRPDLFIAMAAYADYGPWYIGTTIAYEEGGYETSPPASNVAPEVEPILTRAIEKLLR